MKEKYMKDFNGEKIFSLEYDKETLRDMVLDKQEEIERLYNKIFLLDSEKEMLRRETIEWEEDCKRAYNIINELEKMWKEQLEKYFYYKDNRYRSFLHQNLEKNFKKY